MVALREVGLEIENCPSSAYMTDLARKEGSAEQLRTPDAVEGSWVDRYAPDGLRPYLRLSRADRPIGTWLLLLPCWWGLMLSAASGEPPLALFDAWLFAGCAIGAALMRGAGCTWNDLADRELDAAVARTRNRPLPAGLVSVPQALAWMIAQALAALCILLTFDGLAIVLGFLSLVPVAVYPFAKRFTWWPQVFLGIAFNWGALLAWAAHSGTLGPPAYLLYLSGICWTLFYDTIYAYQDIDDDALIGIKSTARLFGDHPFPWLSAFAAGSVALMLAAVLVAVPQVFTVKGVFAIAGTALFGMHLLLQLKSLEVSDGAACLRLFRSNRNAGLIPAAFFLAAAAI